MSQTISFESFSEIYVNPSFKDNFEYSIIKCFSDLCSGWKQETFKSIVIQMTRKSQQPLPLYFNSPMEMAAMSNKVENIKSLFNHLNYRKDQHGKMIDRIDTFELVSVIILVIGGEFESFITNIIFIFGFENGEKDETISNHEFHFFLDCLFRGVMALIVPPEFIRNKVERHKYNLK